MDGCISLSFCSGKSQLNPKGTLEHSSPFRPASLASSLGRRGQSPRSESIAVTSSQVAGCLQVGCLWSTSPSLESLREAPFPSPSAVERHLLLHSVCMVPGRQSGGLCSRGWGLGPEPAAEVHPTILGSHTPLLCGSEAWSQGGGAGCRLSLFRLLRRRLPGRPDAEP